MSEDLDRTLPFAGPSASEAEEREILARFEVDLGLGATPSLEHYFAQFPGRETLVHRLYRSIFPRDNSTCAESLPLDQDVPALLGPYRILSSLGQGGQARVFLAEDTRLRRSVALKVLADTSGPGSAQRFARLRREAAIASRLSHPGLCVVHDVGQEAGFLYVAMRYVPGQTLAQEIASSRERRTKSMRSEDLRSEIQRFVQIGEAIALALDKAHESGVVHRDIKPGNIMITPDGEPVVLDFGLARDDDSEDAGLTRTGDVFGTPAYMSPEQIRGQAVDRRTDVWSLGVVLYEALTLEKPFAAPTRELQIAAITALDPTRPTHHNPALSRDLEIVLLTACEKSLARRYQTTADFAYDLRAVLDRLPIRARPLTLKDRLLRWMRRSPARAALVAVLALGVPILAGLFGYIAANRSLVERGRVAEREVIEARALEKAWIALYRREQDLARSEFQSVLDSRPEHTEAKIGFLLLATQDKELDRARDWLDAHPELVRDYPILPRYLTKDTTEPSEPVGKDPAFDSFLRGSIAIDAANRGDPEAILRALRHHADAAAKARAARPLFHFYWALTAGRAKDHRDIDRSTSAISGLWPDSPVAWWVIGRSKELASRPDAIPAFEQALHLDPKDFSSFVGLGDSYARLDRYEESLAVFERLLAQNPANYDGHWGAGTALLRLGRYEESLKHLRPAVKLRPSEMVTQGFLGEALLRLGHHNEAVVVFRECVRIVPKDAGTHILLAGALFASGNSDGAVQSLERALVLDPRYRELHNMIIQVSTARGDDAAVLREHERLVLLEPNNAEAWIDLGLARFAADDLNGAEAAAERAKSLISATTPPKIKTALAGLQRRIER